MGTPKVFAVAPCHVTRVSRLVAAFVAALLLAASVAQAQYIADYQTNTIDGVVSNWNGRYVVGSNNVFDVLRVINGGVLTNIGVRLSAVATASNNLVVVDGNNSRLVNTGDAVYVGTQSSGNMLIITNGGTMQQGAQITYLGFNGANNVVLVSGANSLWSGGALHMGYNPTSTNNQLIINNGGHVTSGASIVGEGDDNNKMVVSDSGSLWTINGTLSVAPYSHQNTSVIISNGGSVFATSVTVAGGYYNALRIVSGGVLDANSLDVEGNHANSITNFGGIFQFSTNAPTIAPSGGRPVLTNGTLAFRNITNADVYANQTGSQLTNITYQGANTFRLNAATNAASGQDYIFGTGRGATNYVGLEMINGGTAWRGGSLTIGSGGSMLVSNTAATVAGAVTNSGKITVMNASVVYGGNVVNQGAYVSDPSTNTFNGNFTVGPTGYVSAASNDVYAFGGDFIMGSTNKAFNLSSAHVLFATNGYGLATTTANHLLSVSNSGALNLGTGQTNFSQVASNFAFGTLSIAVGNRLSIAGNKDISGTNALYVGWLDIQGTFNTNNYTEVTNALFLALSLPNVNLYYDKYDSRNGWLNANLINSSAAGYNLWGGNGLLLPIPEPSPILAVGAGLALLTFLRRRAGGQAFFRRKVE